MDEELRPDDGTGQRLEDHSRTQVLYNAGEPRWRKAIPVGRDRMQSRVLTLLLGMALAAAVLLSLAPAGGGKDVLSRSFFMAGVGISVGFAVLVSGLRAATPGGAMSGGAVCLLLIRWSASPSSGSLAGEMAHTALTPLVLLFVGTFAATRSGRQRKLATGLAESRRGRSAAQVMANLGAAGLCAFGCGFAGRMGSGGRNAEGLLLAGKLLALAALAEATADTVSSEIGQAFGGAPRLLPWLRPVPVGTDGAVSLLGTTAGIVGALLIALAGQWAMDLGPGQTLAAAAGGIAGLLFDSVLGATAERRGWIGNDLVNFSSTVFAALTAGLLESLGRL